MNGSNIVGVYARPRIRYRSDKLNRENRRVLTISDRERRLNWAESRVPNALAALVEVGAASPGSEGGLTSTQQVEVVAQSVPELEALAANSNPTLDHEHDAPAIVDAVLRGWQVDAATEDRELRYWYTYHHRNYNRASSSGVLRDQDWTALMKRYVRVLVERAFGDSIRDAMLRQIQFALVCM